MKQKKGVLTIKNTLQVLAKWLKFSLDTPKQLILEQAKTKLTNSYQAYFKARQTFPPWREEFQMGLIKALAKDKDRPIAQTEAQMKRENHQQIIGRQAKFICQKNRCDPIVQTTATNSHGEIYECLQKDNMVATMAKPDLSHLYPLKVHQSMFWNFWKSLKCRIQYAYRAQLT